MDSLTLSASETLCSAGAPPQERILHGPPPGAAYMDRLPARLFYYMYTCMLFEWLSNGWARTPRFAAHTRLPRRRLFPSPQKTRTRLLPCLVCAEKQRIEYAPTQDASTAAPSRTEARTERVGEMARRSRTQRERTNMDAQMASMTQIYCTCVPHGGSDVSCKCADHVAEHVGLPRRLFSGF